MAQKGTKYFCTKICHQELKNCQIWSKWAPFAEPTDGRLLLN